MGRSPARDSKSTGKTTGKRGSTNPAKDIVNNLDAEMNPSKPAVDESAQEAPKQDKPKRGKVAELAKLLEEANKKVEEANKKIKEQETLIAEYNDSFMKRNQELAAAEKLNKQLEADRNVTADNLRTSQNRINELENTNKDILKGSKSLLNRKKEADEKNERLSKNYQDALTQNSILTESIRQSALKSDKEVTQAQKELESAAEPKVDNSGTAEETVTPEGEAKVEGEPKANTEQATQEPNSEAKQTSTESSEMTPEEAYEYLSDKKNFKEANTYFSSGKDSYIGTNGKHLPKSWFDVYNGNKESDHSIQNKFFNSNNKDVFTASLRDKGLLEDPKKEPSREEVEKTLAETEAKAKFDKWIDSKGNKFRGIFGKHKVLYSTLLLAGISPAIMKAIDAIGDWGREQAIDDMQVPDAEFWGSDDNEDYNGEPIEPGEVADKVANAAQETGQTNNTAEEQAAQALQENLPQGVAGLINQDKGESSVATNASTPASTKASTAESAPTQGLPPVVTKNTPSTNPDSSGMTYSQRVEMGQAPQEGSMAYNANNPDMVTANLINAMNQAPQAGSDAIGYGDLYDQNFIDFWAKRNPNLAYAVSQGRKS